jgi:hypothetical protein
MNLQESMFSEVENWLVSGESKTVFLTGKNYSEAKFNYWLLKWKVSQRVVALADFREVDFTEVKLGKVLEIEAPSGVKITVFA